MARQGIFTGSSPNDGTGDSLAVGAVKVNQNFSEIYSTFGDGNNLTSYVSLAGVSSLSGGLIGTPNITVNRIVAGVTSNIIPFYWDNYSDLPPFGPNHGTFAHVHETGKAYYAHGRWVELVNSELDRTVGTGTENYRVGVVTANFFYGDGSNLTNIGGASNSIQIRDDGSPLGAASTINFGSNLTVTVTGGIASVSATGSGLGTETDPIFTASVAFGISSTNISNWNTAYGWGNHASVGYTTSGYVINALVGYATEGYVTNALVGYATTGYVTTQIGLNTFTGAASTITSGQIFNWDTAYSWGNHATVGYVTSLTLNQLVDVNAGGPSTGQVLKWSGTEWEAASDLTASGGTGIGLSDLSVTINPAGINSLTYNNTTGVFLFTPTSLVGYATTGYVTTQIGLNTFTGAASTITSGQISNWNTAYSWGNHSSAGYLTNVNITAGSNITVLETSEGNFIITSTSVAGAGGTWAINAAGIHTTKNVGIGTALSSSALTVEGDGRFSGVVTATRFQSTSAGTPTIDSPNNLNINAVTVAISTDVTVGRELTVSGITTINGGGIRVAGAVTATSFIGDGSGLTGVIGSSSGIVIKDSGSTVGTAGTIDFGDNLSVSVISAGIVTVTASGGTSTQWVTTNAGIHTLSNVGVGTTNPTSALTVKGNTSLETLNVSGITTSSGFDGNLSGTASTVTTSNQNYLRLGSPFSIYSASSELFSVITDRNLNNKKILIDYGGKMYFGSKVGGSLDTGGFADAAMIITPGNEGGPYSSIQLDGHISAGGTIGGSEIFTNQLNASGIATATSFRSNSTVGDGTDVGFAIKYYITASGFSAYRFAGPGLVNTTDNPTIYLHRGFTYIFENSTGGSHPFAIRYSSGGTGYGATYLSGSQSGTQVFTVPFDAPATLVYQCTIHSGMLGTFNIVS